MFSNVRFVQCDVTDWDSQVKLFETAKRESPDKSVDVVIACAGISGVDPVFYDQGQRHSMNWDADC